MRRGDVLGHEFMGEIVDMGPDVKGFQLGDRVVSAFDMGCDQCMYCNELQLYSMCDSTNPRCAGCLVLKSSIETAQGSKWALGGGLPRFGGADARSTCSATS